MRRSRRRRLGSLRQPLRRGAALLAALALMALSAALLALAFAAATGAGRASRSSRAAILADGEARRALAQVLAAWGPRMDSLAVGEWLDVAVAPAPGTAPSLDTRSGIRRLGPDTWLVVADVTVAQGVTGGAHRRLRLLLGRATAPDSATAPSQPAVLRQWALSGAW